MSESRSERPARILGEVYAKLMALVIQHGIVIRSCWRSADRSVLRASKVVSGWAWAWALVWWDAGGLAAVLSQIALVLPRTGRVDRRTNHPSAFQVIDDPVRYWHKTCG